MNDDDLIRRGDALEAVAAAMWARDLNEFQRRLRALPAAAPRPMGDAKRDGWDVLLTDARAAAERAMVKFPQPNYVISKVAEEAGEVVKAAIHCAEGRETAENLRGEMVQTIAMLYRLWAEGDGVHGLPAVRAALPHPETPE